MDRYAHQAEEIQQHALDPARALFWSPRTGKTHGIGGQVETLEREADLRRGLIIAPQFVCKTVWAEELSGHIVIDLSSGTLKERREHLRFLQKCRHDPLTTVLLNWEALAPLVSDLLAWDPQLVVADEAHFAKSAGAARSRALHRLSKAKYRRILTGTPTPRDYIDLYSQYKFLDPNIFGTSKAAFEKRYCELDPWGRPKFYRNLPELRTKMNSVAHVFDRAKAWKDLPPQVVPRRLFLPAEARTLYDDLVRKTVAEWDGVEIDATHKLARITKLQELTAGYITDELGDPVWVHSVKIDAAVSEVMDLVAAGEKVVVFYHFDAEGKELLRVLDEKLGEGVVGRIGGGVPVKERIKIQQQFAVGGRNPMVVVMQDSLGIGISLKAASYLVRMSYPLDYAAYLQSNERIYEPGKALTYITLDVEHSIDAFARRICMDKKRASDALLGFEAIAYEELPAEHQRAA